MREKTKIVLVADFFYPDFTGGAELTTDALLSAAPADFCFETIRAIDVTSETIESRKNCLWIFGNFTRLNYSLLPAIAKKLKYVVIEYDFKFCIYQSPEKHEAFEFVKCDCEKHFGKRIEEFYRNAQTVFFMSEKQRQVYFDKFPSLLDRHAIVLSSVFNVETLNLLKKLRNTRRIFTDPRFLIVRSDSWIKGYMGTVDHCRKNRILHKVVGGMKPHDLLKALSGCAGLAFLPPGGDSCPRIVIEAKLLGKKLVINDNVMHRRERWFDTDNLDDIEDYLKSRPVLFWQEIREVLSVRQKGNLLLR